ncbi:hypothetical protein ACERK3_01250 [Phycisphaerales bacterium AB-hyl4]|uniref:Uncharacterized protein n=1 Tax=Natronomicrosphaera hydrolytica TaxID=3242702 RepID=A0ABV4U250_9BACT
MPMFAIDRLVSLAATAGLVTVLGVAGWAGFRLTQAHLKAEVYQHRLVELSHQYEQLRGQYNEAVRRTAVTELVVADGEVTVHIRTAEGLLKTVPTGLDPQQEIYVDYLVLDGRLWIRRVFDDRTPPRSGVVIDTELSEIDWDSPRVAHGQAVYRQLDEGRWVVTVTGSGALGLTRIEADDVVELAPPPQVRDYQQVETEVSDRLREISTGDVVRQLFAR